MICSAFEVYDPSIFRIEEEKKIVNIIWSICFIFFLVFFLVRKWRVLVNHILSPLQKEVIQYYREFEGRRLRGLMLILFSVFLIVVFVNISGLLSYTFSLRRHIIWTFRLGFPIWLLLVMKSYEENPTRAWCRFIPNSCSVEGNPQYELIFCLGILELIRLIIQPLTLSIRLMANVAAGHLAIRLGSRVLLLSLSFRSGSVSFFLVTFYYLFELAVNLVQGYIFFLLLLSYSSNVVTLKV